METPKVKQMGSGSSLVMCRLGWRKCLCSGLRVFVVEIHLSFDSLFSLYSCSGAGEARFRIVR